MAGPALGELPPTRERGELTDQQQLLLVRALSAGGATPSGQGLVHRSRLVRLAQERQLATFAAWVTKTVGQIDEDSHARPPVPARDHQLALAGPGRQLVSERHPRPGRRAISYNGWLPDGR
jgi:hypothetical protein